MRRKRRILTLVAVATALGIRWHTQRKRRLTTGLTAAQERFIGRATALEAQQVAFYHLLAIKADRLGLPHLAAGYRRAMEEEARHLQDFKIAGRRLNIPLAIWELLGDRVGRLSGNIISKLHPMVGLRITNGLEQVAAKEYARQRQGLHDVTLLELYMKNQVDEEKHFTWAALMLKQFPKAGKRYS